MQRTVQAAEGQHAGVDRLGLSSQEREALWRQLTAAVEGYVAGIGQHPVSPRLDPAGLRRKLEAFDFREPHTPAGALDFVVRELWDGQVHTPHPRYFGLFNPAPTTMGVMADALVAGFNPQMAAWSHSPFAVEVEQHLLRAFGERLGWARDRVEGTFSSGGAEANQTALLLALCERFPAFRAHGARGLPGAPVLYTSAEGHHSFLKAARQSGLGTEAVRVVPTEGLRMDVSALAALVAEDRAAGRLPFLVVATAGTTSAGTVDPLPQVAELAGREGLWFHVDAAWGGAAALVPELRGVLAGVERADSVTFDAHKWLSVPMGAGMLLTRHPGALARTFAVSTAYMPRDGEGLDVVEPFQHSMQWSRRFIGLKLFLSLAVAGWDGYADAVRRMTGLGESLRRALTTDGWTLCNDTPLPVVCFVDPAARSDAQVEAIARAVVESGEAWISPTRLAGVGPALRACITNYRTTAEDVQALVLALHQARAQLHAAGSRAAG
jgi:aromatic-L-amino-acid/L-tryptophan decarboxylase